MKTLPPPVPGDVDLLLRETHHRCSNDLQLVVGLLDLQSRRAGSEETRQALADAMERVAIVARARGALYRERQPTLEDALHHVCEALGAQAEPRGIAIAVHTGQNATGLTPDQITNVALVVNELATNAIKHAFKEGASGRIDIAIGRTVENDVKVTIDDDGLPLPPDTHGGAGGLGLGLSQRMMAAIAGRLILPTNGSKIFQLTVPVAAAS